MTITQQVAAVIRGHYWSERKPLHTGTCTGCGWQGTWTDHCEHVADVLAALALIRQEQP